MISTRLTIGLVAGVAIWASAAPLARADSSVTVIGISPAAACAAAAAMAKLSGVGTRAELEACNRVIEAWPPQQIDLAGAYVNRSVVRIARGEMAAAAADASTALRFDGGLAEAYLDRGIALSGDGRRPQALDDFGQALRLNLQHPELAYFDRAAVREDMGDIRGAYEDYRRAASLNPAWVRPRQELARFTVVRGVGS